MRLEHALAKAESAWGDPGAFISERKLNEMRREKVIWQTLLDIIQKDEKWKKENTLPPDQRISVKSTGLHLPL